MPRKSKATNLWANFAEALRKRPEKRPEGKGWLTVHEMKEKFRVGICAIRETIRREDMDVFTGFVILEGRVARRCWYRPKAKPIRPKEKP